MSNAPVLIVYKLNLNVLIWATSQRDRNKLFKRAPLHSTCDSDNTIDCVIFQSCVMPVHVYYLTLILLFMVGYFV